MDRLIIYADALNTCYMTKQDGCKRGKETNKRSKYVWVPITLMIILHTYMYLVFP